MQLEKYTTNEKVLLFGRWTSKIGDIIFDYVNSTMIVRSNYESSILLAIYQSSEIFVSLIFNVMGGVTADGNDKKKFIVITDMLCGVVSFILSFFVESKLLAYFMVIANMLLAIFHSFNAPIYKSITREIIQKERIGKINSISNGGAEIVAVFAPLLGIRMVYVYGARVALLFTAFIFFISGLSELLMKRIELTTEIAEKESVCKKIIEGFRYLVSQKNLISLILLSAFINFFLAGYNLLVPYTTQFMNTVVEDFYGNVLIAEAVGGIIGSIICSKIKPENYKIDVINGLLLIIGISLICVPILGKTNNFIVCILPFLICTSVMTVFNIQCMTIIQMTTDKSFLGRIFSIVFITSTVFMPCGSFTFSAICNKLKIYSFLVVGGGIILADFVHIILKNIQMGK